MTAPTTRVVSAKRREKLQERWADPKYAEREKARLRAMSQEQRDALAFYRAHRADPRLAAPPPPPPGPPAPVPPAPPKPEPRPPRRAKKKPAAPSAALTGELVRDTRGRFFLGRRPS
jgi:hypothetical protein